MQPNTFRFAMLGFKETFKWSFVFQSCCGATISQIYCRVDSFSPKFQWYICMIYQGSCRLDNCTVYSFCYPILSRIIRYCQLIKYWATSFERYSPPSSVRITFTLFPVRLLITLMDSFSLINTSDFCFKKYAQV